jgi:hypothetical protein
VLLLKEALILAVKVLGPGRLRLRLVKLEHAISHS